jgi:hypothetical protein
MKYYTIHINDSGAIENAEESLINGKDTLICEIYDAKEFNRLNDILHSLDDYIMNEKALNIFKECNLIPYKLRKVVVNRKEYQFGIIKATKTYDYTQLKVEEPRDLQCYNWINFEKSDITVKKGEEEIGKLQSHIRLLELVEENEKMSSDINEIYKLNVSDKEKKKITDIGFAETKEELGKVWKPHFPIIEFETKE